jgi:hypothetical protein
LISNGGILVVPDATIIAHRDLFILFAGPYRLPAVYPWPAISSQPTYSCLSELTTSGAAEGGVLCIDRILRGAKAVNLPAGAGQIPNGSESQDRKDTWID